jgi:ribosomal protein L34
MHYPKKVSKIRRVRRLGFRATMSTRKGRKMLSNKRRIGRSVDRVN